MIEVEARTGAYVTTADAIEEGARAGVAVELIANTADVPVRG